MKKLLVLLSFLFIASCDPNPTVKPGYILTEIRPIGFKAEPVEAVLGDTLTMSLFIGGRTFSQDSDLPVSWLGISELTLPYNKPFTFKLPDNIENIINNSDSDIASGMIDSFKEKGFADIPVIASFEVPVPDSEKLRTLTITKTIRIYEKAPDNGVRLNPVISYVEAAYLLKGSVDSIKIKNGDNIRFSLKDMPNTIGFKSVPDETTGYDRLNYRWYFGSDTESSIDKDIDIKTDLSDLGDFVPADEKVTPNRQYFAADFTRILDKIKADPEVLPVTFNFYHVLRDKATSAESSEDYRWGTDHMWFTIEITE
ncbi:MAG TPA: hypothetical protein PLZ43_05780 [bacterium]|nr:hypothetical protein [bacterium]